MQFFGNICLWNTTNYDRAHFQQQLFDRMTIFDAAFEAIKIAMKIRVSKMVCSGRLRNFLAGFREKTRVCVLTARTRNNKRTEVLCSELSDFKRTIKTVAGVAVSDRNKSAVIGTSERLLFGLCADWFRRCSVTVRFFGCVWSKNSSFCVDLPIPRTWRR